MGSGGGDFTPITRVQVGVVGGGEGGGSADASGDASVVHRFQRQ